MGGHELCWVLTAGPAAVSHAIVIHAESEERGIGSARNQGTPPRIPLASPILSPPASRVPDLMGNGESRGQADIFIDTAAPLALTHSTDRGQAWGMGTRGGSRDPRLRRLGSILLREVSPQDQGHPPWCVQPMGLDT